MNRNPREILEKLKEDMEYMGRRIDEEGLVGNEKLVGISIRYLFSFIEDIVNVLEQCVDLENKEVSDEKNGYDKEERQ